MKNYGLKLDKQEPQDYVFGAVLPTEILQQDGDWSDHLPVKEFQNLNGVEPYACVSYTLLNCVEILIKRKYGVEKNYSERFLAAISGTKEGGNSPKTVAEFLRKIGVVPQEIWPFDTSIDTFEKFYSPVPAKIYQIAEEFRKEFDFKYEFVPSNHTSITRALKSSPLLISVSAWFENDKGQFYRPDGMTDNHATTLFVEKEGEYMRVFDSYDRPVIKDIVWTAIPQQVMSFKIAKKSVDKPLLGNFWQGIIDFIKEWFSKRIE